MPTLAQMRLAIAKQGNPIEMQSIGVNEAPDMVPKEYMTPNPLGSSQPQVGGVATRSGMPIGGIDMSRIQPGQQMLPQALQQSSPVNPQTGMLQEGQQVDQGITQPQQTNILSLTPQGQALSALKPVPQGMADGGSTRPVFKIMPAKESPKSPENFTAYDSTRPNIPSLARAFREAIDHHLSLSPEDRKKNSIRADQAIGEIIGRVEDGSSKDLLGKNEKLLKSEKGYQGEPIRLPDGRGVETTGLALSPAYEEGKFNTCPNHRSCKAECLGKTSGNYFKLGGGKDLEEFKGPRLNSLLKTQAFLRDPHSFAVKLFDEISDAKAIAAQNNNHLGVRLNVLSDINPLVHKSIIENHPDVTFYDYTKNNTNPIADNHHYTYSSTGATQPGVENDNSNWKQMRKRLDGGYNVAMAFSHKSHLPDFVHDQETGKKYRVINGDTHDFRPLDIVPEGEDGVIIGLKNKKSTSTQHGAHKESHGFFVHYDPQLKVEKIGRRSRFKRDKLGNTIPQNRSVNIIPQSSQMVTLNNDSEIQK